MTEFGTVKDPAQLQALYAYSPYRHAKDGAAYPPILFLTGENDPRVDPMQSRKMTARLQAATANKVRAAQTAGPLLRWVRGWDRRRQVPSKGQHHPEVNRGLGHQVQGPGE